REVKWSAFVTQRVEECCTYAGGAAVSRTAEVVKRRELWPRPPVFQAPPTSYITTSTRNPYGSAGDRIPQARVYAYLLATSTMDARDNFCHPAFRLREPVLRVPSQLSANHQDKVDRPNTLLPLVSHPPPPSPQAPKSPRLLSGPQ
ncbi:hypothetical protein BaRGS_00037656, partial [Batillaria attramentaria]